MALKKQALNEAALKKALEKKDLELVSYAQNKDGSLSVEANKLYPALTDNSGQLYVPLPVTLNVSADDGDQIRGIRNDTPDNATTADAKQFVKMLIDNKELSGLSGEHRPNTTHQITINDKGQRIIRRRGFSGIS